MLKVSPPVYKWVKVVEGATKSVTEAAEYFTEQHQKIMAVIEQMEEAERDLEAQQARLAEQERIERLDIDLRLKRHGLEEATKIIRAEGLLIKTEKEIKSLLEDRDELADELASQEKKANQKLNAALSNQKRQIESEKAVEIATLEAQLSGVLDKVTVLQKQVDELLVVNRDLNETNRQHAAAQSVVNVSGK